MRWVIAVACCFLGLPASADACFSPGSEPEGLHLAAAGPTEATLTWSDKLLHEATVNHQKVSIWPTGLGENLGANLRETEVAARSYTFTAANTTAIPLKPKTTYETDANVWFNEDNDICWANTAFSNTVTTPAFVGVNSHATWLSVTESEVKREFTEAQALGVNHIRVPIEWGAIETSKGSRPTTSTLTRLDLVVNEAASHGIKVDGTIDPTPSWASIKGNWNDSPSEEASRCETGLKCAQGFARWLAERYGTKLAAIGSLNEPNNTGNYLKPNGEAFSNQNELAEADARETNAFYTGAHEAKTGVKVLFDESGNHENFIGQLLTAGVKYDALAIHPYADGGAPAGLTKSKLEEAHNVLVEHGVGSTPVWANEWGYSTEDTEAVRAEYTKKGVELLDGISYVEGWAYYQLHDPEGTGKEESFGLLKHDFTPRPSFAAFKEGLK